MNEIDEYLVIDFDAFQETRVGLHIADHDTKGMYVPGAAHGDKELPSFPVRTGAIRPLGADDFTVQTSLDVPLDVPWADDIICVTDSADALPAVDFTGQVDDLSAPVVSDEKDY